MDFVDWCGVVLDRLNQEIAESREARLKGVGAEHVARLLFGDSVVDSPNYMDSRQYEAMKQALTVLLRMSCISYLDGTFGRFPQPVKPTERGREGSDGLASWWGMSRLERLEPEHEELIDLVNEHSEHSAPDHAWLQPVEESGIFAQHSLAEDLTFLRHIVREIGFDSGRRLLASGVSGVGARMLVATYEGLVWGTRRETPLPFAREFELLGDLLEAQEEHAPDFAFVMDDGLRAVLAEYFREARISHAARAYIAASMLYTAVIEGVLLDALMRPEVQVQEEFIATARRFKVSQNSNGELNWDRVSMTHLLKLAEAANILNVTDGKLLDAAKDYRDAIHPKAAARSNFNAGAEDASVLYALARLIHAVSVPSSV